MELTVVSKRHGRFTVFFDDADYPLLSQYTWHVSVRKGKTPRVATTIGKPSTGQTVVLMHRMIMDAGNMQVDHINGNGLDNRRENLRLCTNAENNRNRLKPRRGQRTSQYKGVCFNKVSGKFQAYIKVNRKLIHLGVFTNDRDGAVAYNIAAQQYFGEFAKLNPI